MAGDALSDRKGVRGAVCRNQSVVHLICVGVGVIMADVNAT